MYEMGEQLERVILAGVQTYESDDTVQSLYELRELAMDDEDMRNAIGMDREYTKEVSFDYLENSGIKRSARERRRYNKLIKVSEKIKITLLIE